MKTIIYILIAIVLVGGLYFLVRPKPTHETINSTRSFDLVVKNKQLVSGPATIQVKEGDMVSITITNDEDEELHLHGYDKSVDLAANVPSTLTFTANLTGRFIYELEHSSTEIGALEVQPK